MSRVFVVLGFICSVLAGKAPVLDVPGDVPELMSATRDIPSLYNFGTSGATIMNGYQTVLLGDGLPVASAPHTPWAKPYAKGKLRVLALVSVGHGYADPAQVAQVCRELDCEFRVIQYPFTAMKNDEAFRSGFFVEQAMKTLSKPFDVLLLSIGTYGPYHGYRFEKVIPDVVAERIVEKARDEGMGLVFIGSYIPGEKTGWWVARTPLKEAVPALYSRPIKVENSQVTVSAPWLQGLTTDTLAPYWLFDWKLGEGTEVVAKEGEHPLIITGTCGKARTVLLGWAGTLIPANSAKDRLKFEHQMALALRAITWAGRKEPPLVLNFTPPKIEAGKEWKARFELRSAEDLPTLWLECTVREAGYGSLASLRRKVRSKSPSVLMPELPAGGYWLEVIARDRKSKSLGWGIYALSVQCAFKLELKTDKEIYSLGDVVRIEAKLSGAGTSKLNATVLIEDAAGRVLLRETHRMSDRLTVQYEIEDARVAPHTVTVNLFRGGLPLLRERTRFFVPIKGWNDYHNVLWPIRLYEMNKYLRDYGGITAVMDGWGRGNFAEAGSKIGIRPFRMNDAVLSPALMQTDPAKGETQSDQYLKRAIEVVKRYGALAWSLQDERHCMKDPGMPNEEGLKRFREYLGRVYGTLQNLNEEWETNYKSWDEVKPKLTKDLRPGERNFSAWVDLRLYVAEQCARADARHCEMIRKATGYNYPIGIDAFTTSGHMIPYGGLDFSQALGKHFNFYVPYRDDIMIRSMYEGPMARYVGWYMPRTDYFGLPWKIAFHGGWGTLRFCGATFWSAFGWLLPAGRWCEEGTRELREGVGKLLIESERQLDPIAILYSYPSMMTTAIAGRLIDTRNTHLMWRPANWSRKAFEEAISACGFTYSYITEERVQKRQLLSKKVLVIPHLMGMALSDTTCRAIEEFVRQGGIVVADLAPALCDEHGKFRKSGGLDDLFGVTRDKFEYHSQPADYLVGVTGSDPIVPAREWFIGEWLEKGLKVTDGTALGKHWFIDIPALVTKKTGKGQTLLLNFLHTTKVRQAGRLELRDLRLMESILSIAGLQPPTLIQTDYGKRIYYYEVTHFTHGRCRYTGIYRDPLSTALPRGERIVAVFPLKAHTYDVRKKKYLGFTDRAELDIGVGEAELFAHLPYRILGVKLRSFSAKRGDAVSYVVQVLTDGEPGQHIVHLAVYKPDGTKSFFYSRNIVVNGGVARGSLSTALNDPPGRWRVVAREVISGMESTADFRLKR